MIRGHRILAVIPARGGSRGVPGKNIKPLAGRPLIAYTIDVAQAIDGFDRVVVSTDDDDIKAVAQDMNCDVIDRPAALASAEARTESAVLHAIDILEAGGEAFDYVAILEPTTPFRTAPTVRAGLETLIEQNGHSLLAVYESKNVLGTVEGTMFRPLFPDAPRRRQDREPVYAEAGTVYACRVDHLRRTKSVVAKDWLAYVVSEREAVDINTADDFAYAEFLAQRQI